jgi:hypothetical protein
MSLAAMMGARPSVTSISRSSPRRIIRQGCIRTGEDGLQRCGEVRNVPRAASVLGTRQQLACAKRHRHRRVPSRPFADPHVPDITVSRIMDASEGRLLPRRALRHFARRGEPLRCTIQSESQRSKQEGSNRVSEGNLSITTDGQNGPRRNEAEKSPKANGAAGALDFRNGSIATGRGKLQVLPCPHAPLATVGPKKAACSNGPQTDIANAIAARSFQQRRAVS